MRTSLAPFSSAKTATGVNFDFSLAAAMASCEALLGTVPAAVSLALALSLCGVARKCTMADATTGCWCATDCWTVQHRTTSCFSAKQTTTTPPPYVQSVCVCVCVCSPLSVVAVVVVFFFFCLCLCCGYPATAVRHRRFLPNCRMLLSSVTKKASIRIRIHQTIRASDNLKQHYTLYVK